ncbi:MAG: aldehyde ferredoxin oxidoreductase family protein, partial [Candidatus Bathyarchaeia archaeon]
MPCGYIGKILNLDLNASEIWEEDLDWDVADKYVGGRGYAAKILYDDLKPKTDPFSPDNILIIATGPLTGTIAPTSGRFCVSSKSPLTGTVFDSQCGGTFGWVMKRSGFDAIVIKGRSEKPVYLYVKNGKAELRLAEHLTNKLTCEVEDAIKSEVGGKAKVLSIGPAGENLVKIASIISDKYRAAGRGGLGAVMGSKNLKAIAVEGSRKVEVANPKALLNEVKKTLEVLRMNPLTGDSLKKYGTGCLMHLVNKAGVLPTMNFNFGYFENVENISGEALRNTLLERSEGCYACPIRCGRIIRLSRGPYKGELVGGPEFESLWSLGAQCGFADLDEIAVANDLCNRYGIDTISFGNIVGYLIEAHKRGLISQDVLGEVELDWGKVDLPSLIRLTALKSGVGKYIAEGVKNISKRFGGEDFSIHVKGLELPAYDPRGSKGMGLAYATSNRGGCHLRAYIVMSEILSL